MKKLIDKLAVQHDLPDMELQSLIQNRNDEISRYLFQKAAECRQRIYGKDVYVRGLIEFTNYCKNNCYYCGIRAGNRDVQRYRLDEEQILECCKTGYSIGYRTFVLQGGEDAYYTKEKIASIVSKIKALYPDCAVTLSFGEHDYDTYKLWFDAGADRYLLRHETADCQHYAKLHPSALTLENRKRCLYNLKEIGYQVGCGFMVGSPYQTVEHIVKDLRFIKEFGPQMVGIGPFIPHKDTPFADFQTGSVELTLFLLGIVRLLVPNVLLPATTALGTAKEDGRELGILAGANVCMPNLSPKDVRSKYLLYNNKLISGAEAAEDFDLLCKKMEKIGYRVVKHRGDFKKRG